MTAATFARRNPSCTDGNAPTLRTRLETTLRELAASYSGFRLGLSTCLPSQVVAGLVPAISIVDASRSRIRGRRDKPGDDRVK